MSPRTKLAEKAISASLERINLGSHQTLNGMTAWPLLGPDLDGSKYELLDAAIKNKYCEIKECNQPTVDKVTIWNRSEIPILAIHGQLLTGAKQNRSLNLTHMLHPQTQIDIDVACVEQGRWSRGQIFESAEYMQSAAGRNEKLSQVLDNLFRNGLGKARQDRVWAQQTVKQRRLGINSATQDESEIQRRVLEANNRQVFDAFPVQEDQVGIVLFANNSWAVEIFDSAAAYSACHRFFVDSLMVEALEAQRRGITRGCLSSAPVMDRLGSVNWRNAQTQNSCTTLMGTGQGVNALALEYGGVCVSLSASGFLSQLA